MEKCKCGSKLKKINTKITTRVHCPSCGYQKTLAHIKPKNEKISTTQISEADKRYEEVSLLKVSGLSDWDRRFVESVGNDIISGFPLSPKQRAYYKKLLEKYKVKEMSRYGNM